MIITYTVFCEITDKVKVTDFIPYQKRPWSIPLPGPNLEN